MIALRGIARQDKEKRWTWTGVWAFGSLPEEVDGDKQLKTKNPSAVRPFAYTWEEARKASDVLVPSANLERKEESAEEQVAPQDASQAEATDGKDAEPMDDNKGRTEKSVKKEESEKERSEPMQVEDVTSESAREDDVQEKDKIETQHLDKKTEEKDGQHGELKETEKASETREDSDRPRGSEGATSANASKSPLTPAEVKDGATDAKADPITFGTTLPGEPEFTDAGTVYPEKCPRGGAWTGYFDNVAPKGRSAPRVQEKCTLLFNATPPKDARILFVDADEEAAEASTEKKEEGGVKSDRGLLPSGRIHVRGMGTNQFGTFELTGSLDMTTGVLECQKMYITTNDTSPSSRKTSLSKSAGANRGERRVSIGGDAAATTTPRTYSTRKRQLSWRKRASLSEDDDDESSRRSSSTRKKSRTSSLDKTSFSGAAGFLTSPAGLSSKTLSISAVEGTRRSSPTPSPRTPKAVAMGPKKRASQSNRGAQVANSFSIKLPTVGDPQEARWKAAHFLYYQRFDTASDEAGGGGGSTSGSSNTASFVVYEGEMSKGNCLRDGRGICLYNNGTLYEGEWKRNKEHGKGVLMTADRRRVIYKGEWERGRMHGQGVYYYNQDDGYFPRRKDDVGEQGGSRYEGDFKENARHGVGKYILPDGSVYEGEWRENLMSGRGTFRWPDGSIYVGSWIDGKRNGSGILEASGGFTYDGMWVQNAMEGRGIATYPSGQRYEGLWSNGRREGRGTIHFTNGAVYEGRFRGDCMDGQGTMKMTKNAIIPQSTSDGEDKKDDWMIPISFQSDMGHIHRKAGFTVEGE